jgi:uncharacterized membrane protein
MDRGRLEAFSDGVFAIVITIMVLGLHRPEGFDWTALHEVAVPFLVYVLSFVYVGIYWNNHHHLLKHVVRVTAGIMWANMGLLFWLTLFPFVTEWLGNDPKHEPVPIVVYGAVLLLAACAYYVLQTLIVRQSGGRTSPLGVALGRDWKGRLAPFVYAVAMLLAWVAPWASAALYVGVALTWVVPDKRLERALDTTTYAEEPSAGAVEA